MSLMQVCMLIKFDHRSSDNACIHIITLRIQNPVLYHIVHNHT